MTLTTVTTLTTSFWPLRHFLLCCRHYTTFCTIRLWHFFTFRVFKILLLLYLCFTPNTFQLFYVSTFQFQKKFMMSFLPSILQSRIARPVCAAEPPGVKSDAPRGLTTIRAGGIAGRLGARPPAPAACPAGPEPCAPVVARAPAGLAPWRTASRLPSMHRQRAHPLGHRPAGLPRGRAARAHLGFE